MLRLAPRLTLALLSLATIMLAVSAAPLSAAVFTGQRIAIDAGHGGTETGATYQCGNGVALYEKDINAAVALLLRDRLVTDGASVVLTRDPALNGGNADYNVALDQRVAIANAFKAQALVSIHHNGSSNASADWTETYYSQPNDKPLAVAAYDALHAALAPLPGKGAKRSPGFVLTVRPKMPSTLTEAYFVTNPSEASLFCPSAGQPDPYAYQSYENLARVQIEAAALESALVRYFGL